MPCPEKQGENKKEAICHLPKRAAPRIRKPRKRGKRDGGQGTVAEIVDGADIDVMACPPVSCCGGIYTIDGVDRGICVGVDKAAQQEPSPNKKVEDGISPRANDHRDTSARCLLMSKSMLPIRA